MSGAGFKYKAGDKVTDSRGNSVEILETCRDADGCAIYKGRKIGMLWPEAAGQWGRDALESLIVRVFTKEEREALRVERAARGALA